MLGAARISDLTAVAGPGALTRQMREAYPDLPRRRMLPLAVDLWFVMHLLEAGDRVAVPDRARLYLGDVVGDVRRLHNDPDIAGTWYRQVRCLGSLTRARLPADVLGMLRLRTGTDLSGHWGEMQALAVPPQPPRPAPSAGASPGPAPQAPGASG